MPVKTCLSFCARRTLGEMQYLDSPRSSYCRLTPIVPQLGAPLALCQVAPFTSFTNVAGEWVIRPAKAHIICKTKNILKFEGKEPKSVQVAGLCSAKVNPARLEFSGGSIYYRTNIVLRVLEQQGVVEAISTRWCCFSLFIIYLYK